MTPNEHLRLADALLPSVLEAGRLQMRYLGSDVAVQRKDDSSPVTAADHESEAVLLAALKTTAPDIPVLAEERSAAGHIPSIADAFFAVDPLDGTKDFIAGRGEFTINIGLVRDGRPVFGVIYAPAFDALYFTRGTNEAVYCRLPPHAGVTTLSQCALETIHTRAPQAGSLLALTSRRQTRASTTAYLSGKGALAFQEMGSSLKFCLIAHGKADVYARLGHTHEWDTAAGQAILNAAGGAVVTLDDGIPLAYGKADNRFLNPEFVAWGRIQSAAATPA